MEKYDLRKRRFAAAAGILLLALGLIFLFRPLAQAAKLLFISGALALLLSPLCGMLEKHMPPALAATVCLLAAAAVAVIAVLAVALPVINGARRIYELLPEITGALGALAEKTGGIPGIEGLSAPDLYKHAFGLLRGFMGGFASKAAGAFGAAADIVIAAVTAWYMLVSRARLALSAELVIPGRYRRRILPGISEMRLEIMMYLRGQAIIALCVGALAAVGLMLIGIPSAVPLGLMTGLLNMIPYFGPFIAAVPVGILALTEGFVPAALAVGALIAVQQIDGLILSPRIVGSATGFSPATVMISIFAAGAVWGVAGMLAALPLLILIRTCVRVFVELAHND